MIFVYQAVNCGWVHGVEIYGNDPFYILLHYQFNSLPYDNGHDGILLPLVPIVPTILQAFSRNNLPCTNLKYLA